jgi:hypothetical protein
MSMASTVFAWRCRRAVRVLEMRRRGELEADLGAYATGRDGADLLALLDQYDDAQTAEVRDILVRQQLREERRRRPVAGFAVTRPGW